MTEPVTIMVVGLVRMEATIPTRVCVLECHPFFHCSLLFPSGQPLTSVSQGHQGPAMLFYGGGGKTPPWRLLGFSLLLRATAVLRRSRPATLIALKKPGCSLRARCSASCAWATLQ